MKTLSFKFTTTEEARLAIAEDSRVFSSMRRYAFNRMLNGDKKDLNQQLKERFSCNCYLRSCAIRSASSFLSTIEDKDRKVYFGKYKRFQRGLITKDEYKDSRNFGFISEGEANERGNRLFELDVENNRIVYKRNRKEHYVLNLVEKLDGKRKRIMEKLQTLMMGYKAPVTIRIKNDTLYVTYREEEVEKEKRFKNLFDNRILGIDLNPNYFGISVIEFNKKDQYKILYKECIDLTELQSKSKNKIKFELYEINHHILRLCKCWHCGKLSVEDLKFDNKKKFWNKDLNRLCNNQFRFNIIKQHLQTLCNIFGVEMVEVNASYSSIIGNFRHGSETCPDPVASSIEIARRGYKKFQKGWFQPSFVSKERVKQVLGNQWKKELGLGYQSWKTLAGKVKELKLKYRFPLIPQSAVFSKHYIKACNTIHVFKKGIVL